MIRFGISQGDDCNLGRRGCGLRSCLELVRETCMSESEADGKTKNSTYSNCGESTYQLSLGSKIQKLSAAIDLV